MIEGNSPQCLYIPNKDVMFKLMRACINVQNPEFLWFKNGEEDDN